MTSLRFENRVVLLLEYSRLGKQVNAATGVERLALFPGPNVSRGMCKDTVLRPA